MSEEITEEMPENELKLTALKAAISSGFLSGSTSTANQLSLQLMRRRLTQEEIAAHSQRALKGADEWYVPTFLQSPEGQAIAEILGIELPEPEGVEETPEDGTDKD